LRRFVWLVSECPQESRPVKAPDRNDFLAMAANHSEYACRKRLNVKPDLPKMATHDRFVHGKYLGHTHDFVKRFWSEKLGEIALLYAHPKFIPAQIHGLYEAVTLNPILVPDSVPKSSFGILLDPDTGNPLRKSSQRRTVSHATLHFMRSSPIHAVNIGF
jgi:hypothetical protein